MNKKKQQESLPIDCVKDVKSEKSSSAGSVILTGLSDPKDSTNTDKPENSDALNSTQMAEQKPENSDALNSPQIAEQKMSKNE